MKKFVLRFIAIAILSITGIQSQAHSFEAVNDDGVTIYYNKLSDTEVAVTYRGQYSFDYNEYTGSINIPNAVNYDGVDYSVIAINASAFRGCGELTSVSIPESITKMGESVFSGCSSLNTVNFNAVDCQIAGSTTYPIFTNCSNLKHIIFGDNVKTIPSYFLYHVIGLENISLPESTSAIGSNAFCLCEGLASVSIPENVKSIGINAFGGCSGLANVVIPENVESIGYSAFQNCTSLEKVCFNAINCNCTGTIFDNCDALEEIALGDKVESIPRYLFKNKIFLETISLPETTKSIGGEAFYGCIRLKTINLPNGIINIEKSAFYGCNNLENLILPEDLTNIGGYAFSGCDGLESIVIPEKVATIGDSAFKDCTNILEVTFNAINCKDFSSYYPGFYNCNKIKKVTIGDKVTNIPAYFMNGCLNLENIEIPNSVTSIGNSAFSSTGIKSLIMGANVRSVGSNAFYNCNNLRKVILMPNTVPSGLNLDIVADRVTYVANSNYDNLNNLGTKIKLDYLSSMFVVDGVRYVPISPSERTCVAIDCTYDKEIEDITIGETVNYRGIDMKLTSINVNTLRDNDYIRNVNLTHKCDIDKYAFYDCDSLRQVNIKIEGGIRDCAFESCQNMAVANVICTDGIGAGAFSNCDSLKTITINCQGNIGASAMSYCKSLEQAEIECDGLLGVSLFRGCTSLKTIVLSENIKDGIGSSAFYNCSSLETVNIPSAHTVLNDNLFYGCSSLKNIDLPQTLKTIKHHAFANSGLVSITIPTATNTIEYGAFDGCKSLQELIIRDGEEYLSLGYNSNRSGLFSDCPLRYVKVGRNLKYDTTSSYGYSPFYRNASIETVVFTDYPTEVFANEFYGCNGLKSVTLGDNVRTVGNYAFSGCTSLTNFTFGKSLNQIGAEAFSDCTAMADLYAEATLPPTCGNQALDDINKWDCTLHVAEASIPNYQAADQWKDFFFVVDYEFPGFAGDANGDGVITVADVTTIVNHVLGHAPDPFSLSGADVNADGDVNVADLTLTINLLLSGEYDNPANNGAGLPSKYGTDGLLAWIAPSAIDATSEFSLCIDPSIYGVAAQFDITLPMGMTLEDVAAGYNHNASYRLLSGNTYRVVVTSMTNTEFEDGMVTNVRVSTNGDVVDGECICIDRGMVDTIVAGDVKEYGVGSASIRVNADMSSIGSMTAGIKAYSENGEIIIVSPAACQLTLTSISGIARKLDIAPGMNRFAVAAGIYVVNGQKIVVR